CSLSFFFFFSSRRRHTRFSRDWSSDVCSSDLLCVEERSNGHLVINQPAGHLEPDESLAEAALRETLEETAWDVRLTAFVGAYQWQAPARPEIGRAHV